MKRIDFMAIPEISELHTGPHVMQLWDNLVSILQGPSEVDFVRSVIGEELIQMNASIGQELSSLLEILTELRAPNDVNHGSPVKAIPLASANKELLQERLRLLISSARAVPDDVFKTTREKQIVELLVTRPSSSVGSSRGSRSFDSRPTSMGSLSSSRSQQQYVDPQNHLLPLKGSLRFDKVHEVKEQLRDCFRVEYTEILGDVDYIRELIETEMYRSSVATEPTVAELKEMTKKMEDAEAQVAHVEMIQRLPSTMKRGGSLASLKPLV